MSDVETLVPFIMAGPRNMVAKLGAIFCWSHDDPEDQVHCAEAMKLIPSLVMGKTAAFSTGDWGTFLNALDLWLEHSKELGVDNKQIRELRDLVFDGALGKLAGGETKCLDYEFAKAWELAYGSAGPDDFDIQDN